MRASASGGQRGSPMALEQVHGSLNVATRGQGFVDVTREVGRWLRSERLQSGVLTLFIKHTSASLVIQENADPDVLLDLGTALEKLAPRSGQWRHASEGPDDMPGHVRSMLTNTSLSIPVQNGALVLGTWQAVYVAEHRDRPHDREVALAFIGTRLGG
ncbi:MAG: YjbQ family protein [Proteobacteria bacterium]|nr:YjbQ family protein [Pseudomonadota bacterium]